MESMNAVKRYLLERVKERAFDKHMAARLLNALSRRAAGRTPVAVIGISCRFPGADTTAAYWDLVLRRECRIGQFPAQRRDDLLSLADDPSGFADSDFFKGGFLERIDLFDPERFRLSPAEARLMDPYQRLMLLACVEAMEDAGYAGSSFAGSALGVFVGTDHTHKLMVSYPTLLGNEPSMLGMTGTCTGILASRLAYVLDTRGPAVVTDAACSSGLVAIHQACASLAMGECDTAIAAGINIFLCPVDTGKMKDVESGASELRAFDRRAAGTVWGEGVAALLLKPLDSALEARDPIYAVVRGSAVNNNGASNGITAPRAESQVDVLRDAWRRAEVEPETIELLEAHGTGTLLGDPIEVKGLTRAFGAKTPKRQFCAVGSVKSNIGHTVGASGLASTIKAALALRHGVLPPTARFSEPNPFIDFIDSPMYVSDRARPWVPSGHPRRAGVTSLGLSGTNCHLVLEEAPARDLPLVGGPQPLVLSARSASALRRFVTAVRSAVELAALPWADVCHTLAVGREQRRFRWARVVDSDAALHQALADFRDEQIVDCKVDRGLQQPQPGGGGPERSETPLHSRAAAERLVERFCTGEVVDWRAWFAGQPVRRVNLPPTPHELERFWPRVGFRAAPRAATPEQPQEQAAFEFLTETTEVFTEDQLGVARVFGRLLGHASLTSRDNFHALGGDSILAANVVNAIEQQSGVRLDVAELLQSATLGDFLVRFDQRRAKEASFEPREIPRDSEDGPHALSAAQQRIYVLGRIDDVGVSFNIPVAIRIRGEVDEQRLQQALDHVVARHDTLRTSFRLIEGIPRAVVESGVVCPLEREKCSEAEVGELVRRFVRPFDLERAPLLRAQLVEVGQHDFILLLDVHHLVADGTSLEILLKELVGFYHGRVPEPLELRYRDYVAWHHRLLDQGRLEAQAQYWLKRFEDGVPTLTLPTDEARGASQSFEGSRIHFDIPSELTRTLRELASRSNATLFIALLAGFEVLLAKLSQQSDIVVGTPVAGRRHAALESLVGVFINMLALRQQVSQQATFGELLEQVRDSVFTAFNHQDYPFERLVEQLGLPRAVDRSPLFDVLFVMQPGAEADAEVDGHQYQDFPLQLTTSKYDLTLQVTDRGDYLACQLEFSTRLFSEQRARRMTRQLVLLLEQVARTPQLPLREVTLLEPSERKRLLESFNDTEVPLPVSATVVSQFQRWASAAPNQPAVVHTDAQLSYAELDRRARAIAAALVRRGVRSGDVVGILMRPSEWLLPAMLGTLAAGAAYLPLDPDYPEARLDWMLEDSRARCVLADPEAPKLGAAPQRYDASTLATEPSAGTSLPRVAGSDRAYVIYTSGSTGRPKGVIVTHANLVNLVAAMARVADFSEGRRVLGVTTICFDIFVLESLVPLALGMTVALADQRARTDVLELAEFMQQTGVQILQMTPSRIKALALGLSDWSKLSALDVVLLGGEPVLPSLVEELQARLRAQFYNVYGPTETTVWSTAMALPQNPRQVTIGRPIANTRVYVLDDAREPCPIGVPGELWIAGAGVSAGYLNRPALTRERFVPCPFEPKGTMYRTGDRACWLDDGTLQCLGRVDNQVKLRGHRVELGEIESELDAQEGVRQAVVVKCTADDGVEWLSAFVEAAEDLNCEVALERLGERLPEHMVPAQIVRLERLPLTGAGKVDRVQLVERARAVRRGAAEWEAPVTEAEVALGEALEKVLAVSRVGRHDNYFALGGDSIRAIQLSAELQHRGFALSVRDIIRAQTMKMMARAMTRAAERTAGPTVREASLNPFQRELVMRAGAGLDHYNLSLVLEARPRFEPIRMKHALQSLLNCHRALSLRITTTDGRWALELPVGAPQLSYEVHDFRDEVSSTDAEEFARVELIAERFQRRLRMRTGNGFAACLFRLRARDHLLLVAHQLVMDHVSWRILLADLERAYAAAVGSDTPIQPEDFGYLQWLRDVERAGNAVELSDETEYWRRVESAPDAGAPVDHPQGTNRFGDLQSLWRSCLDEEETQRFVRDANAGGPKRLEAWLLSVAAKALEAVDGAAQRVFLLGGHGRHGISSDVDSARTVGRFTCTYPFAVDSTNRTNRELADSIEQALGQVPRGGVGYGLLQAAGRSGLGRGPAIAFSYMGQFDADFSGEVFGYSELPAGHSIEPRIERPQQLGLLVLVARGRLQLRLDYSKQQFELATLERLGEAFERHLRSSLARDEAPSAVFPQRVC